MAALGTTGGVLATFGASCSVFAAASVAGHGRLGAGIAGLATGRHQHSGGKNRREDHHCLHFIYLWFVVSLPSVRSNRRNRRLAKSLPAPAQCQQAIFHRRFETAKIFRQNEHNFKN